MRRNITITLLVAMMLVFTAISLVSWPSSVDKSYPSIRYIEGEEEFTDVNVELEGTIYKSILLQDYFEFVITIDGVRFPDYDDDVILDESAMKKVSGEGIACSLVHNYENSRYVYASYFTTGDRGVSRKNLGVIYFDADSSFEEIVIMVKGEKSEDVFIVSADNVDKAKEVMTELWY